MPLSYRKLEQVIALARRRCARRRSRTLFIEQQYQKYYHRRPGPGSVPWRFYDRWSSRRMSMSYEDALNLEVEAQIALNYLAHRYNGKT